MTDARHLTIEEMEAGLDSIRQSPADEGILEMIVRRPEVDGREVLTEGELDLEEGLVGDSWRLRSSRRMPDGSPHPDMQLNLMNARVVALLAQTRERWQLAGDQLFVDLDLSEGNVPAGTRLAIGSAIIEITAQPHTGCVKFKARFGQDALRFVSTPVGQALHLRGVNARVVQPGTIRVGDRIRKLSASSPASEPQPASKVAVARL